MRLRWLQNQTTTCISSKGQFVSVLGKEIGSKYLGIFPTFISKSKHFLLIGLQCLLQLLSGVCYPSRGISIFPHTSCLTCTRAHARARTHTHTHTLTSFITHYLLILTLQKAYPPSKDKNFPLLNCMHYKGKND